MFGKKNNYLEYHFIDNGLNLLAEDGGKIIDEFISPSSAKSSCWWSNLKAYVDGYKNQFEYVKKEHRDKLKLRDGNYITKINETRATAKLCPAIHSILSNVFLIKCPSDIIITVDKTTAHLYNASSNYISIRSHSTKQFHTENGNGNLFENKMNLKFELPIYIRPNNNPYLFIQPIYHNDTWYDVAPGIIDGRFKKAQPLNVNVLVDIPKDEPVTYELKSGDVLAYMWIPGKTELKHSKTNFRSGVFKRNWSSRSMFK